MGKLDILPIDYFIGPWGETIEKLNIPKSKRQ